MVVRTRMGKVRDARAQKVSNSAIMVAGRGFLEEVSELGYK